MCPPTGAAAIVSSFVTGCVEAVSKCKSRAPGIGLARMNAMRLRDAGCCVARPAMSSARVRCTASGRR
jgi:hypothetical protein